MDSWYKVEVSGYLSDSDRPHIVTSDKFLEVTEWCKNTDGFIYFNNRIKRWIFTTTSKEDISAFKIKFKKTTDYYDKS